MRLILIERLHQRELFNKDCDSPSEVGRVWRFPQAATAPWLSSRTEFRLVSAGWM
jgi:hypothetical protein